MTHAYNESYLNDAKNSLAICFDYLINDCHLHPEIVSHCFTLSGYAEKFETGNPSIVAGISGIELGILILKACGYESFKAEPRFSDGCSKEFWAGFSLAHYQWHSKRRFKDIFDKVRLSEIIDLYPLYHEIDIHSFIETMETKLQEGAKDTNLKRMRENNGLSQSELADKSGVKLRNIQMYEQRVNDINKAQGQILYKLSFALNCKIEDLMENPIP